MILIYKASTVQMKLRELTTEDTDTKTEHKRVAKVKACLEETRHPSLGMIVIYSI